jgi:hypothetical protein
LFISRFQRTKARAEHLPIQLSDFVSNSEAGRKYDGLVTLQCDPDDGDSEEDSDRDVTLRNGRRFPYWASCAGVGHLNDLEEEEAIVFDAAIGASIRDPMNGDASTSAGSAGVSALHLLL